MGTESIRLRLGFLTDVGRARERNEDAYALHLPYEGETHTGALDALFIVADGMGGHDAGDLASRFVADAIAGALTVEATPDEIPIARWMVKVIREVDHDLRAFTRQQGITTSAGSTATVAAVRGATLYVAHVGDSRCYRLRNGELERLTEDHSWVAEQVRAGLLSPDDAADHPKRNLLTQCLGIGSPPKVQSLEFELTAGDRVLLCSDGLHGVAPDPVIRRILADEAEPQEAATRLVALANEAGGPDNVTVIVFDVEPVATAGETDPGTPLFFETLSGTGAVATSGQGHWLSHAILIAGIVLAIGAGSFGAWYWLRSEQPVVAQPTDPTARASDSTNAAPPDSAVTRPDSVSAGGSQDSTATPAAPDSAGRAQDRDSANDSIRRAGPGHDRQDLTSHEFPTRTRSDR